MHVLLVHNPSSGDGAVDAEELRRAIAELGHDVEHVSRDDHWGAALERRPDLVAAAGGDGTVRDVVVRAHRLDVPVAVVPLGTANNIARALDLPVGDPLAAVAAWPGAVRRRLDVPTVSAPAGTSSFVEAVGGGTFADLLRTAGRAEEAGATSGDLPDARRMLVDLLRGDPPVRRWSIHVDGDDVSGEHAAVEVLNTGLVGPLVELGAASDPGDGLLEVVAIDRPGLRALAEQLTAADEYEVVRLDGARRRGRTVELIPPPGTTMHIDDQVVDDGAEGTWRISVAAGAGVRVLR